jgi:hypothetical protein
MPLPTLDEFLSKAGKSWPRNSYVREPGFSELYVRVSRRYFEGSCYDVIDLAKIEAEEPGSGAFTRLVARLREQYPTKGIYVECVLNPRFSVMLVGRLGFKVNPTDESSFYLLGSG